MSRSIHDIRGHAADFETLTNRARAMLILKLRDLPGYKGVALASGSRMTKSGMVQAYCALTVYFLPGMAPRVPKTWRGCSVELVDWA